MRFSIVCLLVFLSINQSFAFLDGLFGASANKPEHRKERLIDQPIKQPINQPIDLANAASGLFALTPAVVDQVSDRGKAQLDRLTDASISQSLPYCGDHVSPARLAHQCNQLTDQSKRRIAIALTNCHLSQASLPSYDCDDSIDVLMCVRSLSRDNTAFSSYTLFLTHVDTICVFLQRQHAEQSIINLIDGLFNSVVLTANQLRSFEVDTKKFSQSMENTIATHQSSIHQLIETLAANETDRFVELISHTESIKKSQSNLLKQLHNATATMLTSMHQSHQLAVDLANQQSIINDNQHTMIDMQQQHQHSLNDTSKQIDSLQQQHRESVIQAVESIDQLISQQRSLSNSQKKSQSMVQSMHSELQSSYADTKSSLSSLHANQQLLLQQARDSLEQMLKEQADLSISQSNLAQSMRSTNADIAQLSINQRQSFENASAWLQALSVEAQTAQATIHNSLTSVISSIDRLLSMDISLLGELRTLHAIIFYSCVVVVMWIITATQRTSSARFYVLMLIGLTIAVERVEPWSIWTKDQSTETHSLIIHIIRGVMCVTALSIVLISAALHRDLSQMSWELLVRNSEKIDESHRLLCQVLQQQPPSYEDIFDDDVMFDHPDLDITERPYIPDAGQKLMTDWLHPNELGLMPPPSGHRRRASERVSPALRPRSRSRSLRKRRTQSTFLG